jgi:histidyl-tRNA synthetase
MTDIDISRRGLGKALKYANGKNIKHVIIVGPKELDDNSVTLRDMKTGDQQKIKIPALIATLKNS